MTIIDPAFRIWEQISKFFGQIFKTGQALKKFSSCLSSLLGCGFGIFVCFFGGLSQIFHYLFSFLC
ncbi:Uncharacterised protein [Neisseria meningitidis]|nr:Uncharacterised protein [Neisseria meningitidis]CWM87828.1 Uncharacterised protein [Neisseria meningitidis]CWM89103.1 Uncharacterised protein [Neisseria meningitidis]CWN05376.1 Uncharacterised protein [Neisseria meningitidis]CWN27719.1 Uncharacterised protein [Neisseria meningitidis]